MIKSINKGVVCYGRKLDQNKLAQNKMKYIIPNGKNRTKYE